MDNGPARLKSVSQNLQKAGDLVSDMAEVSCSLHYILLLIILTNIMF